jgi:hypothetical protein
MDAPQAPPGWYDDPSRPDEKRWWDGRQWTAEFRPAPNGVLTDSSPPEIDIPTSRPAVPNPNARQGEPSSALRSAWRGYSRAFKDRLWVKIATGFAVLFILAGVFGEDESTKTSQPTESAPPAVAESAEPEDSGPTDAEIRARKKTAVAKVVATYYAALNREEYDTAWRRLSASVRRDMDGFDNWRDGYATTIRTNPSALRVTSLSGNSATVKLKLRARDKDACGDTVRRRFAGTWKLRRAGGRWVATDVSTRKLSGRAPVTDPANCEDESPGPAPAEPKDSPDADCNPAYEGACIPNSVGDIDCPDVPDTNFSSVGSDPYRFDGDGDGVACAG